MENTELKEKIYVDAEINTNIYGNIEINDQVIVIDGSYIMGENGKHPWGLQFIFNGKHELLKVTAINKPYPTHYDFLNKTILGHQNNCKIEGNDGNVYYCSKINIRKFTK